MPDRKLYAELAELIRLYCGPSIMFDIQLVLKKEHVPPTRLDSRSPVGRLGWDSWALGGGAGADSRDTVFDPDIAKACRRLALAHKLHRCAELLLPGPFSSASKNAAISPALPLSNAGSSSCELTASRR